MAKKAYLVLENGMVFAGVQAGADIEAVGEAVFSTGVVGYLETLTDPAYTGQIVIHTFPLIGNYGTISADLGEKCTVRGYVCREICEDPSNFRTDSSLIEYLKKENICVLTGVDTRALTRVLRDNGTMNAKICAEIPENTDDIRSYTIGRAFAEAGCTEKTVYPAKGEENYRVTVLDCGVTGDIIEALTERGCTVTRVPYDTTVEEIFVGGPDGIVLSPGPGDPAQCSGVIHEIRKLIGKRPVFGIGLGHQLAALASGAKTVKLPYGHRGLSQPVRQVGGTRTYITAQNHGYAVVPESLPLGARVSYVNANDRTCEGVDYRGQKCFTVQFTPNADTSFLYDQFVTMMGGSRNAQR